MSTGAAIVDAGGAVVTGTLPSADVVVLPSAPPSEVGAVAGVAEVLDEPALVLVPEHAAREAVMTANDAKAKRTRMVEELSCLSEERGGTPRIHRSCRGRSSEMA